jgi:hypothetical protein
MPDGSVVEAVGARRDPEVEHDPHAAHPLQSTMPAVASTLRPISAVRERLNRCTLSIWCRAVPGALAGEARLQCFDHLDTAGSTRRTRRGCAVTGISAD